MAKISKREVYIPKVILALSDYFLITDSEDSKRTKTTEFTNVLAAINAANGISSLNYRFSTLQNEDINITTQGYFFSLLNETNPGLVTKLFFNKLNNEGIDCTSLFEFIVSNDAFGLKLVNSQDPNNVIIFKPTAIVVYDEYVEIDLEDYQDIFNGGLVDDSLYYIEFVFLSSGNQPETDSIVKTITVNINNLSGTGTLEEQICEYVLSLPESQRTILDTNSKCNIVLVEGSIQERIYNNVYSIVFN